MLRRYSAVTIVSMLAFALGCSEADKAVSNDLEEDLRQAEVSTVELAPSSGGELDFSAELTAGHGKSPSRKAVGTVAIAGPKDSSIMALAKSPEGQMLPKLDSTVISRRPRPIPSPTPTRSGPYKSTSDVIRDAPFPIKP